MRVMRCKKETKVTTKPKCEPTKGRCVKCDHNKLAQINCACTGCHKPKKKVKHRCWFSVWVCKCHGKPSHLRQNGACTCTNACGITNDTIDGNVELACRCGRRKGRKK